MREDLSVSERHGYVSQGKPEEDSFVSSVSSNIDTPEHILRTPIQAHPRGDDPLPRLRKAAHAQSLNRNKEEPPTIPRWVFGAILGGVLTLLLAGSIATIAMLIVFQLFRSEPEVVEDGDRTHHGIPVREGLGTD
ncbi:MAG TPA: hypothetical protein ENK18_26185 [Deltaproteobacteria bacterium]|nr:hypothetical protein [Deltaproteobacteria bacterium]